MKTVTVETNQGELIVSLDQIIAIEQPILVGFGGGTLGKYPNTLYLTGAYGLKVGKFDFKKITDAFDSEHIDSIEIADNNHKTVIVKSSIVAIIRDQSQKKINEQLSSVVKVYLNNGKILSGSVAGHDLFEVLKGYLEYDENKEQ